jgi:small ligand-binding sensory domain FIST
VHVGADELPDVDAYERWYELLDVPPSEEAHFVVLADPMGSASKPWIRSLDRAFPRATKIGGLVSGSHTVDGLALFANDDVNSRGVTVLTVHGAHLEPIIAQGCKPIGEPMLITSCEGNRIHALGEKKPADVLRAVYGTLDEDDRELFRTSLFVGLQMKDQVEYRRGDFLIRNLLGVLSDEEAIAVGAEVERWQVLQLHLRDRHAAREDLELQLARYRQSEPSTPAAGALLFSCLGRGEYLFERPNHDSDLFRERLGNVPLAGFFCNGEIGPVGGETFLHAYTSAFGIWRPQD